MNWKTNLKVFFLHVIITQYYILFTQQTPLFLWIRCQGIKINLQFDVYFGPLTLVHFVYILFRNAFFLCISVQFYLSPIVLILISDNVEA